MATQLMTAMNGGVQAVTPAPKAQIIYLDFDGAQTRYEGELAQFDVTVNDSGLSAAQIAEITEKLNAEYAGQNVVFVTEQPLSGDYSTIYVGKTADIEQSGLAETIDAGNLNPNDKAFVNLDFSASSEQIINTISHEVGHIVFGVNHGGEGLDAYGARNDIYNGASSTGLTINDKWFVNDTKVYSSRFGSAPDIGTATLDSAHVTEDGSLYVSSGGTATNITADEYSTLVFYVAPDTVFEGTSNGVAFSLRNGVLSGYINNGGSATAAVNIKSGGTATDITCINGWVRVSSGGMLTSSYISSGGRFSLLGGDAKDIIVEKGAQFMLTVADTTNIDITSGGSQLRVKDGVLSNHVTEGATSSWIYAINGGMLRDITANAQTWIGVSGAYTERVTLNTAGARFDLRSGGTATETVINKGGSMSVSNSLTTANKTTVNMGGIMSVVSRPNDPNDMIIRDTYVMSGGRVSVGIGTVTGELHMEEGANVSFTSKVNFDFDLTVRTTEDVALINNYGIISSGEKATYSILIKADQSKGSYNLADGASGFANSVTVKVNGEAIGKVLTVSSSTSSDFFRIGKMKYTLTNNGGDLDFTIRKAKVRQDFDGDGISDIIFQKNDDHQVGYWMNGTTDWQGNGQPQPSDWVIAGGYDMNGDEKADLVMIGNTEVNGVKGAYIGYYEGGVTDAASWKNIGYLTNSDNIQWNIKVGNITGNEGKNSIIWHAAELGALGIWSDGTDSWISLGSGFDSNWTMLGVGDFNGDGKDDILFSYADGFYTTDIDGNFQSLGTAGSGWSVAAIGDFSGDDKDDLILFNQETGSVMKFENGSAEKWSSLGQLDPSDWTIVGAGDYDGDSRADLLVRQNSTGSLGYYEGGDFNKWHAIGNGVDSQWTVLA